MHVAVVTVDTTVRLTMVYQEFIPADIRQKIEPYPKFHFEAPKPQGSTEWNDHRYIHIESDTIPSYLGVINDPPKMLVGTSFISTHLGTMNPQTKAVLLISETTTPIFSRASDTVTSMQTPRPLPTSDDPGRNLEGISPLRVVQETLIEPVPQKLMMAIISFSGLMSLQIHTDL